MFINKRLSEIVLSHRIITKDFNTATLVEAINKSGIVFGRVSFVVKTKAKKTENIRKVFERVSNFTQDMTTKEFEDFIKNSECVEKCQDGFIVWEL